jgi:outer membrane biosynthesis protein TonB
MMVQVLLVAMLMAGSAGAQTPNSSSPDEHVQVPADATNNAVPGSKDRPIIVSSGVMASLILHRVDPVYPEDAKGVSGPVVMMTTIDDKGKIAALSVVTGPEKLRGAVWDAVKQWTFKPYLLNGRPVYVKTQITVNFTR